MKRAQYELVLQGWPPAAEDQAKKENQMYDQFVINLARAARPAVAPYRHVEPVGFDRGLQAPLMELAVEPFELSRGSGSHFNWPMVFGGVFFAAAGMLSMLVAQPSAIWAVFAISLIPGSGLGFLAAGLLGISHEQLFG